MAETRLGRYGDKWDEYLRRLRSAATDANSQWKHLIPTDVLAQGEDAIKLYVREQERLMNAGLWDRLGRGSTHPAPWTPSLRSFVGKRKSGPVGRT